MTIGKELNTCIENMIKTWQKEHIDEIFQKIIMGDLIRIIENIHKSLRSTKGSFKVPIDLENSRISKAVALGERTSVAGLIGSFLINSIGPLTVSATGFATAGILSGMGLVAFNVSNDFETVRENKFEERIKAFTKEKTQRTLRKEYSDKIWSIIITCLDGYMKEKIIKIRENISTLKNKQAYFKSERTTLLSLQSTVIQNIRRIREIESIAIRNEYG